MSTGNSQSTHAMGKARERDGEIERKRKKNIFAKKKVASQHNYLHLDSDSSNEQKLECKTVSFHSSGKKVVLPFFPIFLHFNVAFILIKFNVFGVWVGRVPLGALVVKPIEDGFGENEIERVRWCVTHSNNIEQVHHIGIMACKNGGREKTIEKIATFSFSCTRWATVMQCLSARCIHGKSFRNI